MNKGASGFFSTPQSVLDPQLFEGRELRPNVRQKILDMFYKYMDSHYHGARDWSMLWLAGSGVSYQWAGDRGNGDLDVLFGIDFNKFVSANPDFHHYDRETIAQSLDAHIKKELWPSTSKIRFSNGDVRSYEVTYYLNPLTEMYDDSIKLIHPYAAFNVTEDHWTVDPVKLPHDPSQLYPTEYAEAADANLREAIVLEARYRHLVSQRASTAPSSPVQHNIDASMRVLLQQVRNMYDNIHLGRRHAFSQSGGGYGDYYNYQWQRAKRDGIISTFNEILNGE